MHRRTWQQVRRVLNCRNTIFPFAIRILRGRRVWRKARWCRGTVDREIRGDRRLRLIPRGRSQWHQSLTRWLRTMNGGRCMLRTPDIVRHVCKRLGSTEIHSRLAFMRQGRLSVHANEGRRRRRRERSRPVTSRTALVNYRLML